MGFTTLESVEIRLPSGDVNANYALKLVAEIRDIRGAVQTSDIGTITVSGSLLVTSTIIFFSSRWCRIMHLSRIFIN